MHDLAQRYTRARLGLPRTTDEFRAIREHIAALSLADLDALIATTPKDATTSAFLAQLRYAREAYVGALRWVRKENLDREDRSGKNIARGSRVVVINEQRARGGTAQRGVAKGEHGIAEDSGTSLTHRAKEAVGTTAAWLVRIDPTKIEAPPEPVQTVRAPPAVRGMVEWDEAPDWVVTHTDWYGKPTEKVWYLRTMRDLTVMASEKDSTSGMRGKYKVCVYVDGKGPHGLMPGRRGDRTVDAIAAFDRLSEVKDYLRQHFAANRALYGHEGYDARRANPTVSASRPIGRGNYPGIFADDGHGIGAADDPYPDGCPPGATRCPDTVEEVLIADEIGKLIDVRADYVDAMDEVKAMLRAVGGRGAEIKGRVKTPFSIINKLRRKRLQTLTDLAGTMIVVANKREVDHVVAELRRTYEVLDADDYYARPLDGYRAMHLIVKSSSGKPVEVQVKSHRMAEIAHAAHTPYKSGRLNGAEMLRITSLAAHADEGDTAAARKVDALLRDHSALEHRLTQR